MTCLGVLDTSHIPYVPAVFGVEEMQQLAVHYSIDEDELQQEWSSLVDDIGHLPAEERSLPSLV
jgi:hypothetical protein